MTDDRPQYQIALSAARDLCNKTGETVVTYYDEDINPDVMLFCTESAWDRMVDNGQVESDWCFGLLYPKSEPEPEPTNPSYVEKIGSATVKIEGWKVTLTDPSLLIGNQTRTFDNYEDAIKCFDNTCNAAAKLHETNRPQPEKPNFLNTVNV